MSKAKDDLSRIEDFWSKPASEQARIYQSAERSRHKEYLIALLGEYIGFCDKHKLDITVQGFYGWLRSKK